MKQESLNRKFPQCKNKHEARSVCLHSECDKYPFFCSYCQDESCQKQHLHTNKILSIGFKQFIRRVLKQRKPPQQLNQAAQGYKAQLQRLSQAVSKFVKRQVEEVDAIISKSIQYAPEEEQTIKQIRDQNYKHLSGNKLDRVWGRLSKSSETSKKEIQLANTIKAKQAEVSEISADFKRAIEEGGEGESHLEKASLASKQLGKQEKQR